MEKEQAIKFMHDLLRLMLSKKASDLFITAGYPPAMKIDGKMTPVSQQQLTAQHTVELVRAIMNDKQVGEFEASKECNFAIHPQGIGRFRVNAFIQQQRAGVVIRTITTQIPKFDDLKLPEVLKDVVMSKRGLVIFVGGTGSGKSTSLAALIGHRNQNSYGHIITIEDPIEFQHQHRGCLVNQREIGRDTTSFKRALKYILRQDPDVVLVGEMRDLETIEAALTIAETGHFCIGSLHTNNAIQSINRIIDVFPAAQHDQIRAVLSFALEGVVTQALLPRATGAGRVLVSEVLIPNAAIRNLIREDKLHQIYSQMQIGQAKYGMQTMNQSLCDHYIKKNITFEDAIGHTGEVDELKTMIVNAGGSLGNAPTAPTTGKPTPSR